MEKVVKVCITTLLEPVKVLKFLNRIGKLKMFFLENVDNIDLKFIESLRNLVTEFGHDFGLDNNEVIINPK